jgi:hypothetical protein
MMKKCTCGFPPNVMDDVGESGDKYNAGCYFCGVPEELEHGQAFDSEDEAVEYFEKHIRSKEFPEKSE